MPWYTHTHNGRHTHTHTHTYQRDNAHAGEIKFRCESGRLDRHIVDPGQGRVAPGPRHRTDDLDGVVAGGVRVRQLGPWIDALVLVVPSAPDLEVHVTEVGGRAARVADLYARTRGNHTQSHTIQCRVKCVRWWCVERDPARARCEGGREGVGACVITCCPFFTTSPSFIFVRFTWRYVE